MKFTSTWRKSGRKLSQIIPLEHCSKQSSTKVPHTKIRCCQMAFCKKKTGENNETHTATTTTTINIKQTEFKKRTKNTHRKPSVPFRI